MDLRGFDPDRPPADPAAVLDGFLRRLGVPGNQVHALDLAGRARRFRQLMADRKAIVLLDNAATEDQVLPLLPQSPTCVVVVTSRYQLSGLPGVSCLRLDVFTPAESLDLLRGVAGEQAIAADQVTAARIAKLVGHLPLALAVVAGRITSSPAWSLADHLERLTEHRERLRLEDSVEPALALSYEALKMNGTLCVEAIFFNSAACGEPGLRPSTSFGPYTGSTGTPLIVVNWRSAVFMDLPPLTS